MPAVTLLDELFLLNTIMSIPIVENAENAESLGSHASARMAAFELQVALKSLSSRSQVVLKSLLSHKGFLF